MCIRDSLKENEDIYGTINSSQIAKELTAQTPYKFKPSDITIDQPIKSLGTYTATIKLAPDVETQIQVTIIPAEDNS